MHLIKNILPLVSMDLRIHLDLLFLKLFKTAELLAFKSLCALVIT
jgi:hypothetical protein